MSRPDVANAIVTRRERLPRLLGCRELMAELGVKKPTAERIMRHCQKVKVGARVFVREDEVRQALRKLEIVS